MLGVSVFGFAVDKALDLVELVHTDDAASVLAVAAGFTPKATRPARVPLGSVAEVDDLVHVIAGQRHLGGTHQIQVVVLVEVVDLVGVRPQEAGALHDLGAHQHRRDHQGEPVGDGLLRGHVEQAELQERTLPGEEVEARAGHLGTAFHVDETQRLTQLQMIFGVGDLAGFADVLEHHVVVLATGRGTVCDDVGDGAVGGGGGLVGGVLPGDGGLDLLGEFLALGQQRGLLVPVGFADLFAECLLFGSQGIRLDDGRPASAVGLEQRVHQAGVFASGALRRPNEVRILAKNSEVDHDFKPYWSHLGAAPSPEVGRPCAPGGHPPALTPTARCSRPGRTWSPPARPTECRPADRRPPRRGPPPRRRDP